MARIVAAAVAVLLLALGVGLYGLGSGWFGRHEGPGEVTRSRLPAELVRARAEARRRAAPAGVVPKQILFGDLHVHTTFSQDAFLFSLPMLHGEGAHPPADACDFARFCSALDFWSINDHAERLSPTHWRETVQSIRDCNAVAGDPADPDVVAFLGWEWTQVGQTPENHYGHKNVVLRGLEQDEITARPIAARYPPGVALRRIFAPLPLRSRIGLALATRDPRVYDMLRYMKEVEGVPECPIGVPVRELPEDCIETAGTPRELFDKLDDWGVDSVVIPHGTTWGLYTPPGSTWDKQLSEQHDPDRQTLIEVYSGHGNSEEYRDFRAVRQGPDGRPVCPEPTPAYLPSCWQAGEIIRKRCLATGEDEAECEARAAEARQLYLEAGVPGHLVVPGATALDWLDAGQCRDCFLPSFNYRPGSSVQYVVALSSPPAGPGFPRRFRFGFIASSDNHTARPGTGYKEFDRRGMTEAAGPVPGAPDFLRPPRAQPEARAHPVDFSKLRAFQFTETERAVSFLHTGGLVAVHAEGRDRESIWQALTRREVYGTSGPRILLWFDLLNPPGGRPAPMGSEVTLDVAPVFRARAVGSLEQKPGCPEVTTSALSPERLRHLCRGECYNPGDRRRRITRIEVIRIRRQARPGEAVGPLVEDPWQVFPCPAGDLGCEVAFSDPDYPRLERDVVYYVRAIEEPSPAVNGANLRCTYDEQGRCVETRPCYGDETRTPYEDDCLAPVEERAWSSPIYLNRTRGS